MTKPKLTYYWGYGDDFNDGATDWSRVLSGMTAGQTYTNPQINDEDVFELKGTCDDAGNEFVHYDKAIAGSLSTNIYDTAVIRWRTSNSSLCGVNVKLTYTVGDQNVVGVTDPVFSTDWITTITALDSGKTISNIELWLNDYPNTTASGTYYCYFDFIILCKLFTFPFVSGTEELELEDDIAYIQIPRRVGRATQYLGADSPTIKFSGKMNDNTSWRGTGAQAYGYDLMWIWKRMHADPFQWLSTDLLGTNGGCKVTMPKLNIKKVPKSKSQRMWEVLLKHYSKSSGDAASWNNLGWLGAI